MTVAELNALLTARSESEHVEFKEAKNNFHFEKLVAYCVALNGLAAASRGFCSQKDSARG